MLAESLPALAETAEEKERRGPALMLVLEAEKKVREEMKAGVFQRQADFFAARSMVSVWEFRECELPSDGKAKMKGERLSNANERVENQRSRLPMNELFCGCRGVE